MVDVLNGLKQGEKFFKNLIFLGLILLGVGCFVSSLVFWMIVYTNETFKDLSILMIRYFTITVYVFGISGILWIVCQFLILLWVKIKLKKEEATWKVKKKKK